MIRLSYPLCLVFLLVGAITAYSQPTITSFTPTSGPIGTSVTITGDHFGAAPGDNIVFFGSVKAQVTAASSTSLTVIAPAGASAQPITVTTSHLTGYAAKPFTLTFPGSRTIAPPVEGAQQHAFEAAISFGTDPLPLQLGISDLDGDGKPDLVTANDFSTAGQPGSVSVLRNTSIPGSISYADKMNLTMGTFVPTVAIGDLDGDGKPDIATGSITDQTISLFKNTSSPGALSFAGKQDIALPEPISKIIISDIDLDGRPDLIVANLVPGALYVFRNTTTGGILSFADRKDLPITGFPRSIVTGDMDGDGKPDLVIGNEAVSNITILKNTCTAGAISFATGKIINTTAPTYDLALGDLDGDDQLDIAMTCNNQNIYSILRNTGNLTFATPLNLNCGSGPIGIAIGDVTGDGLPDVVVSAINTAVGENKSTPGNLSFLDKVYLYEATDFPAIGDLDGDGKMDLVATMFAREKLTVFRNRNNEPVIIYFSPKDAITGTAVDIDGYDFDDVTAVSFGGTPAASFMINSSQSIRAIVGTGTTGELAVTGKYGTSRSPGFQYHGPPTITSFSPLDAGTGDTLVIKGKNFEDITKVELGGTAATWFKVDDMNTIHVVVGSGSTGNVHLVNTYGEGSLAGFTYFPTPVISSFTPTAGDQGATVTITGNYFNKVSAVTIGGVPVSSYIVQSPTSIQAVVADGGSGAVTVTTPGHTGASTDVFAFPILNITGFSTMKGDVGSSVTITGAHFRSNTSDNVVYFGAARAVVTSASRNSLTVTVPAGATYGSISVTANHHTVSSAKPFIVAFPPGAETITDSTFQSRGTITDKIGVGTHLVCDLDGDGKDDVLYFNGDEATLYAYRNTSTLNNISFETTFIAWIPDWPSTEKIAIGDVTGDGKPDLIINDWSPRFTVYRNTSANGTISFAPGVDFPAAPQTIAITVGDVDGDGRTDLMLMNGDGTGTHSNISFFLNNGHDDLVSFLPKTDLVLEPDEPVGGTLQLVDMDGDGIPDILTANSSRIKIFRNRSTPGHLQLDEQPAIRANQWFFDPVLGADLDQDGLPDLITGWRDSFSYLHNTSTPGSITFGARTTVPLLGGAERFAVGQLDGDGIPDLIVSDFEGQGTIIYQNTSSPGTISLADPMLYKTKYNFNWQYGAAIFDADGDGKSDMLVNNGTDKRLTIFRSQVGEKQIRSCAPADLDIPAGMTGTTYQWQRNGGPGFADIQDNQFFKNTTSPTLQIKDINGTFDAEQYRCIVDGTPGITTNLRIKQTVYGTGTIVAPEQACLNQDFLVRFDGSDTLADGWIIESWSGDSSSGTFKSNGTGYYTGIPVGWYFKYNVPQTGAYFYKVMASPATTCAVDWYTDTVFVRAVPLLNPVLTQSGNVASISNADPAAHYTWQMQDVYSNWSDITPTANDATYKMHEYGNYRVRAQREGCTTYSNTVTLTITAVNTVTTNSMGIKLFPNPVHDLLYIDSLNLSDKWTSLEIIDGNGRQRIRNISLEGQTHVTVPVAALPAGVYAVLLRRTKGAPAIVRVLKL